MLHLGRCFHAHLAVHLHAEEGQAGLRGHDPAPHVPDKRWVRLFVQHAGRRSRSVPLLPCVHDRASHLHMRSPAPDGWVVVKSSKLHIRMPPQDGFQSSRRYGSSEWRGGACVWCLCSDQDWRAAALWYAAYCGVSLSCWPLQMNGGMFVRFGSERAVMCPCAGIKTRSMSCESRARFAPSLPAAFARPCLHPSEYSAARVIENGRRRRRQVGLALGGSSRQARRNTMAQSDWPYL